MKASFAVLAVCLGSVWAEAPYAPSGWKPNGALLVLPARQEEASAPPNQYSPPPTQYGPPPTQYGPPPSPRANEQPAQDQPIDLASDVSATMERLKQQEGANSGVYHVLLPDGRLQKVQFTTAPLKDIPEEKKSEEKAGQYSNQYNQFQGGFNQQGSQYNQEASGKISSRAEPLAYHVRPAPDSQYVLQQNAKAAQKPDTAAEDESSNLVAQFGHIQLNTQPQLGNLVASIQYTEVQPIPAPIYSYSSAPLVRILRSPN